MCQAWEDERNFIAMMDKAMRRRGYEAYEAGVARDDCPEADHPNPEYSDKVQWQYGWDTASKSEAFW